MKYLENDEFKAVRSKNYNYNFRKSDGYFMRWGVTEDDDPQFAPMPEILDFEIAEVCAGPGGVPCSFCYKANGPNHGTHTSFQTAKQVIDKMPWLTQIAFGVDAQCTSNPDTFKILEYARSKGIMPNITVADISDETADKLVNVCGGVAVSRYENKKYCYDSIKKLSDRGLKQVNIHVMLSKQTLPWIYETFADYLNGDVRLQGLNALVLLSLKKKGRGEIGFDSVSKEEFKALVDYAMSHDIPFGFDSCGARKFENSIKGHEDEQELLKFSEPCESSCFSSYVNVHGDFFPCSFTEGEGAWKDGLSVINSQNVIKDIWFNEKTNEFRNKLLNVNRNCPMFEV